MQYQYTTLVYNLKKSQEISFSGQILIHNKEGKLLKVLDYDDGELTRYREVKKSERIQKLAPDFTDCTIEDIIEYYEMYGVNSDMEIVCVSLGSGSTGATNPGNNWGTPDPTINQETVSELPPEEGGGGGVWWTNNCAEGQVKDSEGNCVENIVFGEELSNNHPCVKTLIEKVLSISSPMTGVINAIFENDSIAHVIYDVKEKFRNTKHLGGTEILIEGEAYVVGLNPDLLTNSTDLLIAATVLHESLHAVLLNLLNRGKLQIDSSYDYNLSKLIGEYLELKIIKENFPNEDVSIASLDEYMHDYMVEFIEDMATSLSQVGIERGYQLSFTFYKRLATVGLESSLAQWYVSADSEISEEEFEELNLINKILHDEFNNNSNSMGNKVEDNCTD